jgi:uncharacterized damage-inducible protein DinB
LKDVQVRNQITIIMHQNTIIMNQNIGQNFIQQATIHFNENLPRIEKCLNLLTEEQVWQRPTSNSNSIGNLILHLCGNIRQWVISSIGNQKDSRQRDVEFAATEGLSKAELYTKIENTIQEAIETIANLSQDQLLAPKSVQGYHYSALGNIFHVVEHLSYHVGQIAFWTKALKDKDLGFYADNDSLNITNK